MIKIGIDTGGTFTDCVLYNTETGELRTEKVPTTKDIWSGVIHGLEKAGIKSGDIDFLCHATTVGSNALIQRKGADAGLITTKGFRDLIEIRRGERPSINIWWRPPDPMIQRRFRKEVDERIAYNGEVVRSLDENGVREAARFLKKKGRNSIAVSFLNAYINPSHERRAKEIIKEEFPEATVSLGSDLVPEILEYERTVTATINAFLFPVMEDYVRDLLTRLQETGFKNDVHIMTSAGGILPSKEIANIPIFTLMAGPASGVLCGAYLGKLLGYDNIITTDMGGTSFDYGLIYQGDIRRTHEQQIEFGTIIGVPSLDIEAIGAGGGTIARVDAGTIRVGPESAGANPGPACYGLGGEEPTLTDAEVVLGKINPEMFLGGEMKINPDLAKKAIENKICAETGMNLREAASAIERLLSATMTDKIRVATVGRGYDPAEFAIMAYGGGGPMFIPSIAKELGIPVTIIPETPSVHSALGLILADIRHEFVTPILRELPDIKSEELDRMVSELQEKCSRYLESLGVSPDTRSIEVSLDSRYSAQTAYITIPYAKTKEKIAEAFLKKYKSEYGYLVDPKIIPIEIVNVRGYASGLIREKPTFDKGLERPHEEVKPEGVRDAWWSELGHVAKTNIYRRDKLAYGNRIKGPAIIEQRDTTICIPPGMTGEVDKSLNIIIRG